MAMKPTSLRKHSNDSCPEQAASINPSSFENLSISSKECLKHTMDDIISIMLSTNNATQFIISDSFQAQNVAQNESDNLMSLEDNESFTQNDIIDEESYFSNKNDHLHTILDQNTSILLSDCIELPQLDLQNILNEWDGI
jgi:hypothetical protein